MHGQIIKYDDRIGAGVIAAEDGRRFRFLRSQLLNARDTIVGREVDFVLAARHPVDIIVMSGTVWTAFGDSRASRGAREGL